MTRIIVTIAGVLLLVGGGMQLFTAFKLRGRGPWRGAAVSAAALTVYGLVALSGLLLGGSVLGAVLVWVVAIVVWFGMWLTRRERAGNGRGDL